MLTDDDKWASLAAELGVGDSAKHNAPAEAENMPAKRGRSRGRRGGTRKRAADKDDVPVPMEPIMEGSVAIDEVPLLDDDEANKKRRRRRSRKKKGTGDAKAPSNDQSGVAVLDDEDDAESPADNWKMPTWQELIDSLHRP